MNPFCKIYNAITNIYEKDFFTVRSFTCHLYFRSTKHSCFLWKSKKWCEQYSRQYKIYLQAWCTARKIEKKQPALQPTGWTNDFENILTAEQVVYLDSLIGNFENETSVEIAVVTLDTSVVDKTGFEAFVKNLSNEWAVGKKSLHNGIVIGISAGLKKIRIQNGYGIEPKLSDKETKRIIDEIMIPEFRKAGYFEGIEKTILAIISKLKP